MTGRPRLDRSLANEMMARAAASERRYRHLTELAKSYDVRLPPMAVGDDEAVHAALDALQDAGAPINWALIDIPSTRTAQP